MSWPIRWASTKMEDDSSGCPLKESQGYFQPLTQSQNMAFAFFTNNLVSPRLSCSSPKMKDSMMIWYALWAKKYLWMWGSSLRGSRGRVCWTMQPNFGTTIFLATVPCPFKISQNIPIFPNILGYSSVPIQETTSMTTLVLVCLSIVTAAEWKYKL